MAQGLLFGLGLIGLGFLYFYIVRPIWISSANAIAARASSTDSVKLENEQEALSGTPNHQTPDTKAIEPVPEGVVRTSSEHLPYHATTDELIVWLAIIKVDGKQISANKIADMVGGTRADVLDKIREVRPVQAVAASGGRLTREDLQVA